MFIASKNHIVIPGAKGRDAVRIPRGFVGNVPNWVGGTDYFKALVKDGKISLSEGVRDEKKSRRGHSPKLEEAGKAEKNDALPEASGEAAKTPVEDS